MGEGIESLLGDELVAAAAEQYGTGSDTATVSVPGYDRDWTRLAPADQGANKIVLVDDAEEYALKLHRGNDLQQSHRSVAAALDNIDVIDEYVPDIETPNVEDTVVATYGDTQYAGLVTAYESDAMDFDAVQERYDTETVDKIYERCRTVANQLHTLIAQDRITVGRENEYWDAVRDRPRDILYLPAEDSLFLADPGEQRYF